MDELTNLKTRIDELEKQLEEANKLKDMWYSDYQKLKAKFENFKNTVKSVVILAE